QLLAIRRLPVGEVSCAALAVYSFYSRFYGNWGRILRPWVRIESASAFRFFRPCHTPFSSRRSAGFLKRTVSRAKSFESIANPRRIKRLYREISMQLRAHPRG